MQLELKSLGCYTSATNEGQGTREVFKMEWLNARVAVKSLGNVSQLW